MYNIHTYMYIYIYKYICIYVYTYTHEYVAGPPNARWGGLVSGRRHLHVFANFVFLCVCVLLIVVAKRRVCV